MAIKCGNCKESHQSIDEVKSCYLLSAIPNFDGSEDYQPSSKVRRIFDYTTAGSGIPDIPAGYYAVKSLTGNNDLDFFRVDRPTEGRWAGRTFVKRIIGGNPEAQVRGQQARAALEAIIKAGPDSAMALYGQEIGQCGRCNRHLTDETSRALGIGPVCRSA
jgi:hypothetical protein